MQEYLVLENVLLNNYHLYFYIRPAIDRYLHIVASQRRSLHAQCVCGISWQTGVLQCSRCHGNIW